MRQWRNIALVGVVVVTPAAAFSSVALSVGAQGTPNGSPPAAQQTSPPPQTSAPAADAELPVELFDNVPVLGVIDAVAEDSEGFLWIAGTDGLARWARTASTVFRAGASSDEVLPRFSVTSVVADPTVGVWAAAGELVHVDAWTRTITRTGIAADALAEQDSELWVLSGSRLTRFDIDNREPDLELELPQVPMGIILPELAVATDGTLYVAAELGLWTVSPAGAIDNYGTVPGKIKGLSPRSAGGVFVATEEGIWIVDGSETRQPRRIGSQRPFTAVIERLDGSIWATSEDGTVVIHSAAGNQWRDATLTSTDSDTMTNGGLSPMQLLFEDGLGDLWLANERTIALHAVLEAEPVQVLPPDAPADTQVSAVAEFAGTLWVASADGNLWRYAYSTDVWEKIDPSEGALPDDVLIVGLAPTPAGVWVATAGDGLWWYDRARSSWVRAVSPATVALLDVTPDGGGGAWVSVADGGLVHVDATGRALDDEAITGFDNSYVVVPRSDGLWVGGEGGLMLYPSDGKTPKVWSSDGGSLRGEVVYDITFTSRTSGDDATEGEPSLVFLATNAGLESIDLETGALRFLGADEGVPQAHIHAILPHPTQHAIWLATSGATLHLFDIDAGTVTRSIRATTTSASLRLGTTDPEPAAPLLFITDGLLVAAAPSLGEQVPAQRPVFISSVLVDGNPRSADSEVDIGLGSTLQVEFLAASYETQEQPRFWYQLVGVDSTWRQAVDPNRSAVYASLGSGHYEFVVATDPAADPTDASVARMTVNVNPTLWQQVWFWPLVTAFAVVAAAGEALRRHRLAQRREQQLETLVADRTEELGRLAIESNHANESKARFLSLISHDLRSPLSAVIGSAELIEQHVSTHRDDEDGIDFDKVIQWAHQTSHAGVHLNGMIDDLITVARNSRPVGGQREMVKINEFLRLTVDMIELAEDEPAQIVLEVDPRLDTEYLFDTQRVRQVLVNLTANGIHHGDGGPVKLRARRVGKRDDGTARQHRVEFSVANNGPTIPADDLDQIFEPFFRGSSSGGSGLGLGLAVAHQLAEMLHTTITATSTAAGVTTFSFELDLPLAAVPIADSTRISASSRPVLVVDDEPSSRQLICDVLIDAGYAAVPASSGQDALALVEQFTPAVVITDQLMPEMTGVELAGELRRQRGDNLPIIAVTAVSETVTDAAVFDRVLPKPLRPRDLLRHIESLLSETVP